ncbi:AraC family transcriptional regulator [Echinicola sp. 20G]|uniref:helix-turn-helix domain-containing protein n=1 Tax=Echinicola sp. 20G TaxID=2781961 RepID=UPI001910A0A9|nr:AraC family transcriptional regulator [Echinicola sp. 20G]
MPVDIHRFFLNSPQFKKLEGKDYLLIEYKCPIEIENFQLWIDSHMITYVICGKKDWIAPDQMYEINGGDALFIKKGVYTTKQYFESDYCVVLFLINDDFIKRFVTENPNLISKQRPLSPSNSIFRIDVNDSFESLVLSVFNYLKQGQSIPKELVDIKFKELLFNLILNPKNNRIADFFLDVSQNDKTDLEYTMLKNFRFDLSMEEFARLSGRSLSTFKREFTNHFRTTPGKWLNEKRLSHAKSLLINSSLNINEVCFDCGFKNASHFIRLFKQRFSLPPNQFRQKYSS